MIRNRTVYTAVGRIASASISKPNGYQKTLKAASQQYANKTAYTSTPSSVISKRFYASEPQAFAATESTDFFSPPGISEYKADVDPKDQNRTFAYFMIGSLSTASALTAKSLVSDYLVHFSASADVVAMAKVEVDMNSIPEGKNVIIKWRGKPVFIRHRTADEIQEANQVNISELRHQETDEARTKKPEWLVMLGVCTHLGCVPIGEAGEFGGWFCPCHGSHYDISGRIRKGPAPLNLEIPEYTITEDEKIVIG